jgi:hypothetical protein
MGCADVDAHRHLLHRLLQGSYVFLLIYQPGLLAAITQSIRYVQMNIICCCILPMHMHPAAAAAAAAAAGCQGPAG